MFSMLFEPGKIGTLEVRNRTVMASMGTFTPHPDGYVSDQLIRYYIQRAKGGVGLIVVQATPVIEEHRGAFSLGIGDNKFIPRLTQLTDALHEHEAKCALQLWHQGINLKNPCGPSAVPNLRLGVVPKEMTKSDIDNCVEAFAEAARRAKEAGFDAIEYHGAHAYLISSFYSPLTNRRTDEYGGSPENRSRFALEIIAKTREKVGPDFPLIMRMNGADYVPGGITIEDALVRAPLIAKAGVNALHVSASAFEGIKWQFLSYLYPQGAITHLAAAVKEVVDIPVITVGKISDPLFADKLLAEGKADFVALGRSLLADPEWANKAKEGRLDNIRRCLYCTMCSAANGLVRGFIDHYGIGCTVNPSLLYGWGEKGYEVKRAERAKRVMVVGGGIAGMEAARIAQERGHKVSLYERSDRLGGQWNIAKVQDYKRDSNFPRLTEQLERGLQRVGVEVILNKEVTRELVEEVKPEVVIIASGARQAKLGVEGEDGSNVVEANDVILGKVEVGREVVVIGGRFVGMEVALALAEQGKKVSLLTRREVGRGVPKLVKRTLKDKLIAAGVYLFPDSPVVEIREDGVRFVDGEEYRFLPAETVVMAVGTVAEASLAEALAGLAPEIYTIGDCVTSRQLSEKAVADLKKLPRSIFQHPLDGSKEQIPDVFRDAFTAMHDGNLLGRSI